MASDTPPPPAKRPRRLWIAFVTLIVILVGTAAIAYSLGTQPPSDGGRYDTPQALVAAMEKQGVICARYEAVENPRQAVALGSCYMDDHQTPIAIYATTADAQAEPQRMNRLLAGIEVDMVVGVNWTVNCYDAAAAKRVADAIGGQAVHLDKPSN